MCSSQDESTNDVFEKPRCGHSRKKLWQLESSLHCSVIGTCLSMEELKQFHRKFKLDAVIAKTEYSLHRNFVHIAKTNSYQSKHIQKYLDKKYRTSLRKFTKVKADKADKELLILWDEAVTTGEIAAAYWAVITHPNISESLENHIYGEIHMLSHISGTRVRLDMQQHHQLQHLTQTLQQQLAETKSNLTAQINEKNNLNKQISSQQKQTDLYKEKYNKIKTQLDILQDTQHLKTLKQKLDEYESKYTKQQKRLERMEANVVKWKDLALQSGDQYIDLKQEHIQQKAEINILKTTLQELSNQQATSCSKQNECQLSSNLCGRCILYVGGRSRQCAHFRTVVEQQNGQFLHHDGGLNDGRLRLGTLLPQVDAVFCPLDCVSHEAAYKIKKYCKKHDKKLVWLPRSSLAAFMRGLTEVKNESQI